MKIKISLSRGITEGYKTGEIEFLDLWKVTSLEKLNYSPTEFKNGYRKSENCLPGNNLIVLDIDEGWTVENAYEFLTKHDLMALIATTKSHQKEKSGKVNDRFRILLPTYKSQDGGPIEFQHQMKSVFKFFDDKPDKGTCDMARFYYGNPKSNDYIYTNGWKLLDWEQFKRNPEFNNHEQDLVKSKNLNLIENYWINQAVQGRRNNTFFKAYMFFKDEGYTNGEIYERIKKLNKRIEKPLDEVELKAICRIT